MEETNGLIVFISHSHRDRDEALRLQTILESNHAQTYLDQEKILGGDNLPQAVHEGIVSSDKFLLIWSAHAANSKWVELEWETAYELKKRLIPYLVDSTPLPSALGNFVFVPQEDKMHGNAELLRAVFGKLPAKPKGVGVFPGKWEAKIDIPDGSGNQGLYELELRSNGQVTGMGRAIATGTLGWANRVLNQDGFDMGSMFQPYPIRGNWSYNPGSGLLLDIVMSGYDREYPLKIRFFIWDEGESEFDGIGPAGAKVTFRRIR